MSIVSLELVKQFMVDEDLPYFLVYAANGTDLLYSQQKDIKPSSSAEVLENFVQHADGKVIVKVSAAKKEAISGAGVKPLQYKYTIMCGGADTQTRAIAGNNTPAQTNVPGAFGLKDIYELLRLNNETQISGLKDRHEMELKLFKIEQEAKNKDPLLAWMPVIKEYLPFVIGKFGMPKPAMPVQGAKVSISGAGVNEVNQDFIRINQSLQRLASVDADYINNFELITEYAAAAPDQYHYFIQQLKDNIKNANNEQPG